MLQNVEGWLETKLISVLGGRFTHFWKQQPLILVICDMIYDDITNNEYYKSCEITWFESDGKIEFGYELLISFFMVTFVLI